MGHIHNSNQCDSSLCKLVYQTQESVSFKQFLMMHQSQHGL